MSNNANLGFSLIGSARWADPRKPLGQLGAPTSVFVESRFDEFFQVLHCLVGVRSIATDTQL
jgi:hypothetical protein